jgi:hypothetical protein
MSYLGNSPELNTFVVGVEKFNGSGACTVFTLTRDIDDPNYLEVVVGGVQQTPIDSYTVIDGVLTFTTPPGLGTNNVVVIYRTGTTIAYNQISASQILANSITSIGLGPNSVTNQKIAPNAITGDKLADHNIISSNNIILNAITTNLIATQAVSGNQIGLGAITGNNFAQAITGNMIGAYAVSGNQIGLGAVSANNFAGGGITSNVLSPNLQISVTRTAETLNIFSSSISGTIDINVANSTVYLFNSPPSTNITFNLRANTQNIFDSITSIGQTTSVAIAVKQQTKRYIAGISIDGATQTPFYTNGVKPVYLDSISTDEVTIFSYSVFKTAANSYTVVATCTNCTQ